MSEIKLTVRPFEMGTEKEAALKPLEKAAEVFAAWQDLCGGNTNQCVNCEIHEDCGAVIDFANELADTIQASCNLAARYGINLQAAMERCEKRNRERGRYEDASTNGMRKSSVGDTANRRWMDSDSGGNDSPTCACDRSGVVDSDGSRDAHYKTTKSPEEMSVEELIEALSFAIDNRVAGCGEGICEEWCDRYPTCADCRKNLLDLLKEAHEHEVINLEYEKFFYKEKSEAYERDYDDARRRIADLTHERDGLRHRLEELSDAGITSLHRLLRETVGEAINITDDARMYIDRQRGSNNERCGDCGSIGRDHGGVCGVERARESVLPAESSAQEMSEREKVLERLRGYAVYMTEPPSENANRLLTCITGNKDTRITCKNDVESVRDKLIELLSTPGWDYCETCELVKSDNDE